MKALDVLRLGELFDSLGWPTDVDTSGQFPHLFEKFCRMYARLSQAEQKLMLEISRSYVWIRDSDYRARFLAVWREMAERLPQNIETVAVAPLLKPGSIQPKSSSFLYYQADGYRENLQMSIGTRKLEFCKSLGLFASRYEGVSNVALVLVDDYVGSGDTARAALEKLRRLLPNATSHTVTLLALAAQAGAVSKLEADGCFVIAGQVLKRGISDNNALADPAEGLRVMDQLAKRLNIKKRDRFGYGATEALITLLRTPNNTFPVFWTDKKVNNEKWDSPFTRVTVRGRHA